MIMVYFQLHQIVEQLKICSLYKNTATKASANEGVVINANTVIVILMVEM